LLMFALPTPTQAAPPTEPWMSRLGELAIQDGGRAMPLDTYARNLAVQLTGRTGWSASSGPDAFAGRNHMQLLCDLMFQPQDLLHKQLVTVENIPFKKTVGLDPKQRFFSAVQIGGCKGIQDLLAQREMARQMDANVPATRDQRTAEDLKAALDRIGAFVDGQPLPLVPAPFGRPFLRVSAAGGEPGTEKVVAALAAFGAAYKSGSNLEAATGDLVRAIQTTGPLDPATARAVGLEMQYNHYQPWLITACAYALALILFGVSRLTLRRPLVIAAVLATAAGVATHLAGVGMRIAILGRAPVSNTYEALLWMGLVAIAAGLVAQLFNRKAYYFVAGIAVAELSVLFSNLVPLESQTGTLPAVLRSNYWLIIHVLTITASYGVLAVASILGHVYLVKEVLFARAGAARVESTLSHPLIAQTYRAMQLGLVLLTAGTILGGVWAADSWGRFWGWDPKETWALISIVVYFIILHARYLRWLMDFGMAAWAVLAFASIVWTFYGVNYLMAAGLHSYGFGAGGGTWVAVWAIAEIVFVTACKLRHRSLVAHAAPVPSIGTAATPSRAGA
jgi:cytochrome c-type biogenesis protein CcsB